VRDVNYVALQALCDRAKIEIALQGIVAAGQLHGVEVRRQGAAFGDFARRSNEEIFAVAIELRQRADDIPDVGCLLYTSRCV